MNDKTKSIKITPLGGIKGLITSTVHQNITNTIAEPAIAINNRTKSLMLKKLSKPENWRVSAKIISLIGTIQIIEIQIALRLVVKGKEKSKQRKREAKQSTTKAKTGRSKIGGRSERQESKGKRRKQKTSKGTEKWKTVGRS